MIMYVLIVFIIYTASVLFFIFFYLLINKTVLIFYNLVRAKYRDKLYLYLTRYISGEETKISRVLLTKEKWKQEIIIDILINKTLNIKNEEEKLRINYLSKTIGLTKKLKRDLSSKKVWVATEATRKVGKIVLIELLPIILNNLNSENYDLWTASARALSGMGKKDELVKFLISNEDKLTKWSVIRISDFLNSSGDEHIKIMIVNIEKISPLLRNIFIENLGKRKVIEALPIIEGHLLSEHSEDRIKALKAIGDIGITNKNDEIIELLVNGNWTEKLTAIYAIQSCYIRKAIPILFEMISDSNWWLRLRSAEALFNFGQVGQEKLKWASLYHEDKYAQDMASKVLQDKKIGVVS